MSIPKNYPALAVASFGRNHVVLSGNLSIKYAGMNGAEIEKRKVGGVWGDFEHTFVRIYFKNEVEKGTFLQNLIDQNIPFSYNSRQHPDAVKKILTLREDGVVSGLIRTVDIHVSYDITVTYDYVL